LKEEGEMARRDEEGWVAKSIEVTVTHTKKNNGPVHANISADLRPNSFSLLDHDKYKYMHMFFLLLI
jgi:hypothetical protein